MEAIRSSETSVDTRSTRRRFFCSHLTLVPLADFSALKTEAIRSSESWFIHYQDGATPQKTAFFMADFLNVHDFVTNFIMLEIPNLLR
jgi:hypothetical protein